MGMVGECESMRVYVCIRVCVRVCTCVYAWGHVCVRVCLCAHACARVCGHLRRQPIRPAGDPPLRTQSMVIESHPYAHHVEH